MTKNTPYNIRQKKAKYKTGQKVRYESLYGVTGKGRILNVYVQNICEITYRVTGFPFLLWECEIISVVKGEE